MTAQRWVYAFEEPLPEGSDARALLGGKAVALRKLRANGLCVPPGFTITTDACRTYFEAGGNLPAGLKDQVFAALAQLESVTQRRFGATSEPLLLAVRSGAARSLPGMLATVLHCGATPVKPDPGVHSAGTASYAQFAESLARAAGAQAPGAFAPDTLTDSCHSWVTAYETHTGRPFPRTAEEALWASIEAVFQSWQHPQAQALRRALGVANSAGTSVTVQQLVEPECAGVLLTRDPAEHLHGSILVEAVRGYGERLVRGEATPDRYRITGHGCLDHPLTIEAQRERSAPDSEPLLTNTQLQELAELALRLERDFGEPLDVEWALVRGAFVVLQARGLAALPHSTAADPDQIAELERAKLREMASRGTQAWVRHNLAETLPCPTPLTWSLVRRLMGPGGAYTRMYAQLGYRWPPQLGAEGFLQLVWGRVYCDPDRLARWLAAGLPLRYDIEALRDHPERLELGPTVVDLARADPFLLLRLPLIAARRTRSRRRMHRLVRTAQRDFEENTVPQLRDYIAAERRQALASLSIAQLLTLFEARCVQVLEHWPAQLWLPGLLGGMAYAELAHECEQLLGREQGQVWLHRLCGTLRAALTVPADGVWPSAGPQSMDALVEVFGHRGPGEMELMRPRWREMLDELARWARQAAEHPIAAPLSRGAASTVGDPNLFEELRASLADSGAASFAPRLWTLAQRARLLLPYRERGRHYFLWGYELLRDVARELGRRSKLADDIFFLRAEEFKELKEDEERLATSAARRRAEWLQLQRIALPPVITASMIDALGLQTPSNSVTGDHAGAVVLSRGRARGRVQFVDDVEAPNFEAGGVLVCAALEPTLAPLLMQSAALIVEQGGMLSHGAMVARQLGIPAVVCPGARQWLHAGEVVEVDAEGGQILREGRNS